MYRTHFPFNPQLTDDFAVCKAHDITFESKRQEGREWEAGVIAHDIRAEVARELSRVMRSFRNYTLTPDIAWLADTSFSA